MRALQLVLPILLLSLCACAKTTVVLLPDEKGEVGEIRVTGTQGSESVSNAYAYTEVTDSAQPSTPEDISEESVQKLFGDALKADPEPPQSHLLYFFSDSINMRKESADRFPEIVRAIQSHARPEVSVIGHTDSAGQEEYNLDLSIRRAKAVEKRLVTYGISQKIITIYYHGEKDPLIPTEDNVIEPKNRRVEIFIR